MGKFDDMSNEELLEYLEGTQLAELEVELIARLRCADTLIEGLIVSTLHI